MGRPGRQHWQLDNLEVEPDRPAALELDGEVYRATRVVIEVLPDFIRECQ